MGIARIFETISLERAKIIRITQLAPQLLKKCPVALLALPPDLTLQMPHQIGHNMVIIEQGVINIKQKDVFPG